MDTYNSTLSLYLLHLYFDENRNIGEIAQLTGLDQYTVMHVINNALPF